MEPITLTKIIEYSLPPSTTLSTFKMNMLSYSRNCNLIFVAESNYISIHQYNSHINQIRTLDSKLECGNSDINKIAIKLYDDVEYLIAVDNNDDCYIFNLGDAKLEKLSELLGNIQGQKLLRKRNKRRKSPYEYFM